MLHKIYVVVCDRCQREATWDDSPQTARTLAKARGFAHLVLGGKPVDLCARCADEARRGQEPHP